MRRFGRNKKIQYRIRWKGYSEAHDTWEPADNVHAPDLVTAFHQTQETPIQLRTIRVRSGNAQPSMWSYRSPVHSQASSSSSSLSTEDTEAHRTSSPVPSSHSFRLEEGHDIREPPAS